MGEMGNLRRPLYASRAASRADLADRRFSCDCCAACPLSVFADDGRMKVGACARFANGRMRSSCCRFARAYGLLMRLSWLFGGELVVRKA